MITRLALVALLAGAPPDEASLRAALDAVHRDLNELKVNRDRGFPNPRAEERAAALDDLLHARLGTTPPPPEARPVVWVAKYGGAAGAVFHASDCAEARGIIAPVQRSELAPSMRPCGACFGPDAASRRRARPARELPVASNAPDAATLAALEQVLSNGRARAKARDAAYWQASDSQKQADHERDVASSQAALAAQAATAAAGPIVANGPASRAAPAAGSAPDTSGAPATRSAPAAGAAPAAASGG